MDLFKAVLILLAAWIVSSSRVENGVQLGQPSSSVAQGETRQTSIVHYSDDISQGILLANGVLYVWLRSSSGYYYKSSILGGGLSVAQFSNDGRRIAAGAKESKTYVWTLREENGEYK